MTYNAYLFLIVIVMIVYTANFFYKRSCYGSEKHSIKYLLKTFLIVIIFVLFTLLIEPYIDYSFENKLNSSAFRPGGVFYSPKEFEIDKKMFNSLEEALNDPEFVYSVKDNFKTLFDENNAEVNLEVLNENLLNISINLDDYSHLKVIELQRERTIQAYDSLLYSMLTKYSYFFTNPYLDMKIQVNNASAELLFDVSRKR